MYTQPEEYLPTMN